MEIYIVRHGETIWNTERRLQGRTDIELNENGIRLAKLTGEALSGVFFDKIYCSPLSRACLTAELIRGSREIPIIKDDRIREISFGDWEGRCEKDLTDTSFRYFIKQPELYLPASSGESFEQVCERAAGFMVNVIEPEESCCKRLMIVAHGAINRGLINYVTHTDIAHFWGNGLQKNCGVTILDYTNGHYTVLEENKIYY